MGILMYMLILKGKSKIFKYKLDPENITKNMIKFKDLKEQFTIGFLFEFIKWVFLLIIGIILSYITPEILSKFWIGLEQYKLWLFTILICLFVIIFISIYKRYNRFIPSFPKFDFNFLLLEYELTHIYVERYKLIHRRRYKIKALKNGLEAYTERFLWTGGQFEIKNLNKSQQLILLGNENLFTKYQVKFNRTLKRGDIEEVELEWILYDEEKKALPFVSSPIKEPTELLIVNVEFPYSFKIKHVDCEVSYSHGSKIPISYSREKLQNGKFNWRVENPKLLYHYEVRWFFDE